MHEAFIDYLIKEVNSFKIKNFQNFRWKNKNEIPVERNSNLLRIEILENKQEFEFDYEDLEKVEIFYFVSMRFPLIFQKIFSNFGKIEKIIVKQKGIAFILFDDMLAAYFGQKAMNNFMITETEMKLKVQLCVVENEDYSKKENVFEMSDQKIFERFVIPFQKDAASTLQLEIVNLILNLCFIIIK